MITLSCNYMIFTVIASEAMQSSWSNINLTSNKVPVMSSFFYALSYAFRRSASSFCILISVDLVIL